jgi:alpha-ketoglutarate-dependent 2,4-dichlorophenoxyacetate dioxygenase
VKPYLAAGRKNRLPYDELFDVSNLEDDGSITQPNGKRDAMGRGNSLFHVDSSFNPRRAGFSLLRAHILPPKETGGSTDFADTRAAWDALPEEMKKHLLEKDYVVGHSLWHSRKKASPDSPYLQGIDPRKYFISRHRLVQTHERSGRKNLYIAAHAMQVEAPTDSPAIVGPPGPLLPPAKSDAFLEELWLWAQRPEFVLRVDWESPGDLVVWDNTCVMHRAGAGTFHGKYKRDMRRATVHDGSSTAWGLNAKSDVRMGLP